MNISFNMADFEAVNSRKASINYDENEDVRIANEILKNKQPITVKGYVCGVNDKEYFGITSKGINRLSIPATEGNCNLIMQYALSGEINDCLKTLQDSGDDQGDNEAMLSIARILLENSQTIQMIPSYKTDGHIRGTWYSPFVNFKFYFPNDENIARMFKEHNHIF